MRQLALACAALLLTLAACSGGSSGAGDCCKKADEIKAQMPKCCATPDTSECCKKGDGCCKK